MISAYRLPQLLVRLVQRLDGPGTTTYIHVDARTDESVYRAMADPLSDRTRVHFLPRHPCHWGDFGHVRATLKGLSALIESERPFDYVVLLTGQDYPIESNAAIQRFLGGGQDRVFMDARPLPIEYWGPKGGVDRYQHRYYRLLGGYRAFPGRPWWFRRANAAWRGLADRLGLHRSFPRGLRPYGGSSYWMMPADCVRHVDRWVTDHPEVVRFFRRVLIPDEMFFQTVVMNSPFRGRHELDHRRLVHWRDQSDSPSILTMADLPLLRESGALFARKFDPSVDAEVLDRIDRMIGGPAS